MTPPAPGGGASPGLEAALGAVIGVCVAAALATARLTPLALFAPLVALVIVAIVNGRWRDMFPAPGKASALAALFLAYCFASTLWADQGGKAIGKLATIAAMAAASVLLWHSFMRAPETRATRAARALVIGFAAGLTYILFEVASGQQIQIATYNLLGLPRDWMQPERHFFWEGDRLIGIEPAHINRSLAVAAMLAFPAALAARRALPGRQGWIAAAAFAGLALVATVLSRNESAMAALAAGGVMLAIAAMSPLWARRLAGSGWVFACMAVLLLAMLIHRTGLHNEPWLHHSLAHRIIIWNNTAEETMKRPVLGIGAYMTYVLMPARNKDAPREEGSEYKKTFSRHAHNVYLQTWFELGAIGALLFMAAGLALIGAIGRLGAGVQPFALATFTAAATLMSSSYGMWQTWYVALFALAIAMLGVGAGAAKD